MPMLAMNGLPGAIFSASSGLSRKISAHKSDRLCPVSPFGDSHQKIFCRKALVYFFIVLKFWPEAICVTS